MSSYNIVCVNTKLRGNKKRNIFFSLNLAKQTKLNFVLVKVSKSKVRKSQFTKIHKKGISGFIKGTKRKIVKKNSRKIDNP